jgi:hypothetical protein
VIVVGDSAIQIARGPFGVAAIVVSARLTVRYKEIADCVKSQATVAGADGNQHCCQAGDCYGDK